jgi:hypothetical protein
MARRDQAGADVMLQRHPHADRGNDLYETPPEAVRALMRVEPLPHKIWEPACGPGAIVRVLSAHGHRVIGSDVADYGDPTHFYGRDFLLETKAPVGTGAVVTNPPYRLAAEFVAHAIALCPLVIMLLRLTFMEAGTGRQKKHQLRRHVLDEVPPARMHVFADRLPMMHRDGWDGKRTTSQVAHAWYIWERSHVGRTTIDRIHWKDSKSFAAIGAGGGHDASAPRGEAKC